MTHANFEHPGSVESEVDGMGNGERYRAENVDPLNSQVLLDGPGEAYPRVIAKTATLHDAEKIARALNDSRGAVDALREIHCVLGGGEWDVFPEVVRAVELAAPWVRA